MSAIVDVPRVTGATPRNLWAFVPALLLLVSSAGLAVMAAIASDDPGFALEENYYERAVNWDREQQQRVENARLGYQLSLETPLAADGVELRVTVVDRAGAKLEGAAVSVEAFAIARGSELRKSALRERSAGTYGATLGAARPGLWEFRFSMTRGSERFTRTLRADLPGARGGAP